MDDASLVRAAVLGDDAAFAAIVDRHGPSMFRFARRMLADDDDAGEAVQEAFISAWKNIESFQGRSTLRTWLFSLTHRRAADIRRRRRPIPTDDEILAERTVDALADPSRAVLEHDLLAALQTTLTALPWRQRAVWVLREIEELSYDEIAEALSMGPDAVRGQLYRARRHVTDRMEAWR